MKRLPTDPNNVQIGIEQRMRTVRILWFGLLASVGFYFAFARFRGRPENLEPNNTLSLALLAAAVAIVLLSFVVKNKLISRAIEQRQVQNVQQAYVVAWAMSEVPALLGLVDFFTTSDPYFYILFIIAAIAELLHHPRREHFLNASLNPPINL